MITKKDAIKLGKEICKPAMEVINDTDHFALTIKGTCITIMDRMWFNVFDSKLKEQFLFNKENFYKESGWI